MSVLRELLRFRPLEAGGRAPTLSLTAEEGTWIKLRDFEDHLNVVLVFFQSESSKTEAALRDIEAQREQLEALDTVVFGVHTARTDRLRNLRAHLGLRFHLLYDPLAMTARAFGVARKVRPLCRDATVLVDKRGQVLYAARGHLSGAELLKRVAEAEGKELAPQAAASAAGAKVEEGVQDIDSREAERLLAAESPGHLLIDVRTLSEFEADHSPSARHLPLDELPHRYQELGQVDRLIFVCQAGDRSAAAAEFMLSIGATQVYNVVGGMATWQGRAASTGAE